MAKKRNIPAQPMGWKGIKRLLIGPNGLKKSMAKANDAKMRTATD